MKIFSAWHSGRHDEARELFEQILPVIAFSNQHIDVSGRFWKYVRVRQGIFTTDNCRLPRPLDEVQWDQARRLADRVLQMEPD